MANVLNNLAADIYKAADTVGRELVGVVPSATLNFSTEGAAIGDNIRSFATRAAVVQSITPSMTIPEGTDQTVDNKVMVINQIASVQIPWTGEDMKHANNGSGFETIYGDQIQQAIRAIANTVESYVAGLAYKNASRAFGVSGTTPFASNFNEVAELRQILVDNGASIDGTASLVMNTIAGTKLRNLAQLQKVSESGSDQLLRQGELLNLQGLSLKESAGIASVTAGTGTAYTTNTAGYAVGATTITLITGSGTALAGDVVTFAGDSNQYVVAVGVAAPGAITLAAPGLRKAIPAAATAMTIAASYTANLAFKQSAIEVAMRPMANPAGGDAAVDSMVIQDPRSGLVFAVDAYKGFKKAMFMVSAVYDAKVWKPDFVAILKG
ncbi:P22 coat - protein 5 family protein [Massilia antarctica]|uniref:P22 coat - protein 5 family protein n=1 Tax=Massilia antarctica TaxID=2765360 RepID=UPI00226E5E07|nr:P22 coat - protein 5 family protein [Massilia sp. H27-R4]MCY0910844.1 P22 coat - protein 5 family protein [Massilia sp. H27-R4]